jgi:hypothetical protein
MCLGVKKTYVTNKSARMGAFIYFEDFFYKKNFNIVFLKQIRHKLNYFFLQFF